MASGKYHKEYRLIEQVDEKGRITTESVYCGDIYRFSSGAEKAGTTLKTMLGAAAVGSGCFLISLIPYSVASRTMIVMLPYLFSVLPLWLLLSSVLRLLRNNNKLEQKDADFANDRIPACSMWLLILPGVSVAGEIGTILWKQEGILRGDIVFLIGAVFLLVCALFCFSRRNDITAEKDSLLLADIQQ